MPQPSFTLGIEEGSFVYPEAPHVPKDLRWRSEDRQDERNRRLTRDPSLRSG